MLILTCGCRLDKLHGDDEVITPDDDDPCESFNIDDIDDYKPNGYEASDIISINNDEYVICGNEDLSVNNEKKSNTFLMKINSLGDTIFFQSQYNQNIGIGVYTANSVVELRDGSGGYLICGNVETTSGNNEIKQALFVKCDVEGKRTDYTLGNPGTHCEYITYANRKYVFTGYKGNTGSEDIYVGTVDISSNPIVIKSFDNNNNTGGQKIYAVQALNDNEYLFAGHSVISIDLAIPYVFRLDTDLKESSFSECTQYGNSEGIDEIYITCMTSTAGGYMFAGYFKESEQEDPLNAFILEMDNNCNYGEIYKKKSSETVEIYGIEEVDNGKNYLICGNRKSEIDGLRYTHVMKLNSVGSILEEYPDASAINGKIANIAIGSQCNYMMAGYTEGTGNKILTVKINE